VYGPKAALASGRQSGSDPGLFVLYLCPGNELRVPEADFWPAWSSWFNFRIARIQEWRGWVLCGPGVPMKSRSLSGEPAKRRSNLLFSELRRVMGKNKIARLDGLVAGEAGFVPRLVGRFAVLSSRWEAVPRRFPSGRVSCCQVIEKSWWRR